MNFLAGRSNVKYNTRRSSVKSSESTDSEDSSSEGVDSIIDRAKVSAAPSISYSNYKGTMYDFSVTSKMRGMWFKLLLDAAGADATGVEGDDTEKVVYIRQFRRLQENFPCGMCKDHFGVYLSQHHIEREINRVDGLFNYVVRFMNCINKRIGKEEYDTAVLYSFFHAGTNSVVPCTKNCNVESSMSSRTRSYPKVASNTNFKWQ